jgi:hypothetical protein
MRRSVCEACDDFISECILFKAHGGSSIGDASRAAARELIQISLRGSGRLRGLDCHAEVTNRA